MNASKAARVMQKGGIVVYPTESSYALGCDATNARAIRKIHRLKGRKSGKYFPVIVADIKMAKRFYKVDTNVEKLAKLGITIVTKKRRRMPGIGGFRISRNATARRIARNLDSPIVATSANVSGKESVYKISEIMKLFDNKVDAILGAGTLPKRRPSTVYDYDKKRVLRRGSVALKSI